MYMILLLKTSSEPSYYRCKMYMFLLIAKRRLVILYTGYATRFSLRSKLVAPLEMNENNDVSRRIFLQYERENMTHVPDVSKLGRTLCLVWSNLGRFRLRLGTSKQCRD